MQILVLLADGFEETEFVVPVDLWRRAGFKVTVASVSGAEVVDGLHGIKVQADVALSKLDIGCRNHRCSGKDRSQQV